MSHYIINGNILQKAMKICYWESREEMAPSNLTKYPRGSLRVQIARPAFEGKCLYLFFKNFELNYTCVVIYLQLI